MTASRASATDADYAAIARVAREFALGELRSIHPLAGGSTVPLRVETASGTYVVKADGVPRALALYGAVEQRLNAHRVASPRLLRRPSGGVVASTGHWVQEFIEGAWTRHPTPPQSAAFMRTLGAHHRLLAAIEPPAWLAEERHGYRLADSLTFVLEELPGLVAGMSLPAETLDAFDAGLRFVRANRGGLEALPRQLVDGDSGAENVLYRETPRGLEAVMIDFTPYHSSHLEALTISQYWHHVYFAGGAPRIDRIADELRVYHDARPLEAADREAYAAAFARGAFRVLCSDLTHRWLGTGETSTSDRRMRARCMQAVLVAQRQLTQAALAA